jgi:hypothetical protein
MKMMMYSRQSMKEIALDEAEEDEFAALVAMSWWC